MLVPIALPLLFAVLGPVLGPLPAPSVPRVELPALPAPDVPGVVAEPDALAGWRTVTGAATGLAIGAGVPLAVAGGGTGILVYVYSQALAGSLLGIGPALFALGTVTTVVGAAACLPPCGAILATAGAIWGAQKEGRDPRAALVGGMPGMAMGALSLGLAIVAGGIGIMGFTMIVPWLLVVSAAVLVGLPAPAIAFIGATIADGLWPGVKLQIGRVKESLGATDEPVGEMAY